MIILKLVSISDTGLGNNELEVLWVPLYVHVIITKLFLLIVS